MTFAQKVINFNQNLSFSDIHLPFGIKIMNPFENDPKIFSFVESFYNKFYNDKNQRRIILGINPGRLGAGVTGIPFTDTKRLSEICNIDINHIKTHEPSSVFVYDMIEKFGGVNDFYKKYYINSICPLGFVRPSHKGNLINCNYYDFPELYSAMESFMISCLKKQIEFGIKTDVVYVLGKKNAHWVNLINSKENLFSKVVALEHPRYIVQYKSKQKQEYISKFLLELK